MAHTFDGLGDIVGNGFCIGCGLCRALAPSAAIEMREAPNGHLRPEPRRPIPAAEEAAILALCPGINVTGPFGGGGDLDPVWGKVRRVVRGHAADPDIRFRAASGGLMTAVSQFLLGSGRVAGVLQVAADLDDALASRPVLSRTPQQVLAAAGSRYGTSASLATLLEVIALGEPIAVALKPCDVAAVRNLQRQDARARGLVVFTMAMFCGTVPGLAASDEFLARRGLSRDEVAEFRWRGHGCPGPTYARTRDGREFTGAYEEFWVDHPWTTQFRCKICPDAIGLQADLAVGDAWPGGWPAAFPGEVDPGSPSGTAAGQEFGEDKGFNLAVAHTEIGAAVLAAAEAAGDVVLEESDIAALRDCQPHHVDLRRLLAARLAAARLAGLPAPNFSNLGLEAAAAGVDPDLLGANFAGTLKRLRAGHGDEPATADYAG